MIIIKAVFVVTAVILNMNLIIIFVQTVNDTSPEVREASYNALGTAMKIVGEKPIMPFLQGIENIKMAKVSDL